MANPKNQEREEKLGTLFDTVLDDLIARIKSGEALPSEKTAAITLLRQNCITIDPLDKANAGAEKAAALLRLVSDDELAEAAR